MKYFSGLALGVVVLEHMFWASSAIFAFCGIYNSRKFLSTFNDGKQVHVVLAFIKGPYFLVYIALGFCSTRTHMF